jgi:C-terminal processing protease CtpA/Prc
MKKTTIIGFMAATILITGCGKQSPSIPAQSSVTGIGVSLRVRGDVLEIDSVLPDTPAAKAGLHPGLVVQQIDGTDIVGKPLAVCAAMTRGPIGSKVQLEIIDLAKSETNIVAFTREKIPVPAGLPLR